MKNHLQSGRNLTTLAPRDLLSGEGFLLGAGFGVASHGALAGQDLTYRTEEVFSLPKASGAIGERVPVYWDDTLRKVTGTPGPYRVCIGLTTRAVASNATEVPVKINVPPTLPPASAGFAGPLTGTDSLNWPSIAAAASNDLTIAVPGAALGDGVSLGLPAAPPAGLVFQGFVSAADVVTVRATNVTAAPVDPAALAVRVFVHPAPSA